ncbi:MAG TPA: helix-turn-helix transcriptional regulator [Candidatus Saccharimonadia bacterium]|jgi:transcriptional regulator with XRE-family HTH domain
MVYYAPIYKKLGKRIAELQQLKSLSQQELAHKAGMSPANLWEVINGRRNITVKTAASIADALGVELAELFRF